MRSFKSVGKAVVDLRTKMLSINWKPRNKTGEGKKANVRNMQNMQTSKHADNMPGEKHARAVAGFKHAFQDTVK